MGCNAQLRILLARAHCSVVADDIATQIHLLAKGPRCRMMRDLCTGPSDGETLRHPHVQDNQRLNEMHEFLFAGARHCSLKFASPFIALNQLLASFTQIVVVSLWIKPLLPLFTPNSLDHLDLHSPEVLTHPHMAYCKCP